MSKKRFEVYDINDEVIDKYDDLVDAQISAEYENAKFIFDTETNFSYLCNVKH